MINFIFCFLKFAPNEGSVQTEKQRQLEIFSSIQNKKPKLDINKVVSQPTTSEDQSYVE